MLAVQLNLDCKKMVVFGNITMGELACDDDLAFGVFRVLTTEYREVYNLIRMGVRGNNMRHFVRDAILSGELHVTVGRPDCGIFDAIDLAIVPLKRDRLNITYVKCQRTYVIKPAVAWLKKDLQAAGVIK